MNSIQYTIRSIPSPVDKALRQRARQTGKSLNQIVLDALALASGTSPGQTFHSHEGFVGALNEDKQ